MRVNKNGCTFITVWCPGWEAYLDIDKLLADIDESNKLSTYAVSPEEKALLATWLENAKPGDAQDGWFNVLWIFAVNTDSKNASGQHSLYGATVVGAL